MSTCVQSPSMAIQTLYARIRAVLTTHMPSIVDATQAHLPPDLRIVGNRVRVHVGADLVSIVAMNPEDQHPMVCVYPTLSNDINDVTDLSTITAGYIVEATGGAAVGDAGWSAQQAQTLAACASEALQTHLPSPGTCGVCVWDTRIRSSVGGAPRLLFPRTTWTLWAARCVVDVYYRTDYGWVPSPVSVKEFHNPTNPTQATDDWQVNVSYLTGTTELPPSRPTDLPASALTGIPTDVFALAPIVNAYETRYPSTAPTGTLTTSAGQSFSMVFVDTFIPDVWTCEVPPTLLPAPGMFGVLSLVIEGTPYSYIIRFT